MSSQGESVALDREMWKRMIAPPEWEVKQVSADLWGSGPQTIGDGWEPFAVAHSRLWLRRQSYTVAPPLPPQ